MPNGAPSIYSSCALAARNQNLLYTLYSKASSAASRGAKQTEMMAKDAILSLSLFQAAEIDEEQSFLSFHNIDKRYLGVFLRLP